MYVYEIHSKRYNATYNALLDLNKL